MSQAKMERAKKIRDKINERESAEKIQRLYFQINEKLNDPEFVQNAVQLSMGGHDITDASGHSVIEEDIGSVQDEDHDEFASSYYADKSGPKIIPGHKDPKDFPAQEGGKDSQTGLSILSMTLDNVENTEKFVRKVFHEGLCSRAQYIDGGFERAYLKFGKIHEEHHRVYLELTTTTDKAGGLMDFINKHPPILYDYPVPDLVTMGVKDANKAFVDWATESIGLGKALKLDEVEDKTNIVD